MLWTAVDVAQQLDAWRPQAQSSRPVSSPSSLLWLSDRSKNMSHVAQPRSCLYWSCLQVEKELAILQQLHHPHLVSFMFIADQGSRISIVMDWAGENLREHRTVTQSQQYTEDVARYMMYQLTSALVYMHSKVGVLVAKPMWGVVQTTSHSTAVVVLRRSSPAWQGSWHGSSVGWLWHGVCFSCSKRRQHLQQQCQASISRGAQHCQGCTADGCSVIQLQLCSSTEPSRSSHCQHGSCSLYSRHGQSVDRPA